MEIVFHKVLTKLVEEKMQNGTKFKKIVDDLKINSITMRRWMYAETQPKLIDLVVLADYFKITLNQLIYGTGTERFDIDEKIISYREDTNDYRLCLTKENIEFIRKCQMNHDLVEEIRKLMKEG